MSVFGDYKFYELTVNGEKFVLVRGARHLCDEGSVYKPGSRYAEISYAYFCGGRVSRLGRVLGAGDAVFVGAELTPAECGLDLSEATAADCAALLSCALSCALDPLGTRERMRAEEADAEPAAQTQLTLPGVT